MKSEKPPTRKIRVNLDFADLGQVDLMVQERFYSKRTDFIRTAIRNQLERHADVVKQSTDERNLDPGLGNFSRDDLEGARRASEMLHINVLGLVTIAQDLTPKLARVSIASRSLLGALHASPAVTSAPERGRTMLKLDIVREARRLGARASSSRPPRCSNACFAVRRHRCHRPHHTPFHRDTKKATDHRRLATSHRDEESASHGPSAGGSRQEPLAKHR